MIIILQKMLLRTYSKEEVNDLIQKEVGEIKNELIQHIGKLEQKNRMLEETIEQIKGELDLVKNKDNLLGHVLIGYRHDGINIFIKNDKHESFNSILELYEISSQNWYKYKATFILESLEKLKNFKNFNLELFETFKINIKYSNKLLYDSSNKLEKMDYEVEKIIKDYCNSIGINCSYGDE